MMPMKAALAAFVFAVTCWPTQVRRMRAILEWHTLSTTSLANNPNVVHIYHLVCALAHRRDLGLNVYI